MPTMRRIDFTAWVQALLLLFLPLSSIAVQQPSIEENGIASGVIRYVEDAQRRLDTESARQVLQQRGIDIDGPVFNVGAAQTRYWLGFELQNKKHGAEQLRLLASVAYRKLLNAYLIVGDAPARLILHDAHALTFSGRNGDYRYLASNAFALQAGQQAYILVEYEVIGSSYLPLRVHTEQRFKKILYDDSVNAAFFYSFSAAAIIVFLLFGVAMMDRVSLMYGLLFMLGLLFLASMEGLAFKYVWPNAPLWNHYSPLMTQLAVSSFGLLLSYYAAQPNAGNRRLRQAMLAASVVGVALMVLGFFVSFVFMLYVASLYMGLMFLSQGYALATWMQLGQKRNLVAIIAGVLLAVFVSVLVLLSLDASILPGYFYVYSSRVVYTLASLATMATVVAHVSGLRQDHEKALKNELVLMKREAEINKALYEAEQNYSRARELAHYRQQQLATASHDMRQPLVSLRSTIDAIAMDESEKVKVQLRNAFDYLENLCRDYLQDTRPEAADSNDHFSETPSANEVEPYPASLVLDTAARMFADEARDKGLDFRARSSAVLIDRPPLVLMRIVTNLLSNAVKHTTSGRILLGARRHADTLQIQILDTGKGMDAEALGRLSQAYEKGPESDGEGLGMAICYQLAEQNGMRLVIDSAPGRGTCCSIHIPRVN